MSSSPTSVEGVARENSRGPVVLGFGDSLTAGYGLQPDEAFPARLQALLRASLPDAEVVNAGVSGDTTRNALARLPRLLSSLRRRPDLAIVELGANDLIRRVDPVETRSNLEAIVREFERCSIHVMLASVDPPVFLGAIAHAYSGIHGEVARRHNLRMQPFFPPGVLGHHAHVLRDRMHPNALAIGKVAAAMLPVVLDELVSASREHGLPMR